MKAIQLQDPTGIERLTYDDIARPEPDRDELLVRVHAAGINPIDWLMCRGGLSHLLDSEVPWTPGWDVSGVVEAVGPNESQFNPGDAVCGMARLPGGGGAFAEYTTMTSEELTDKPQALSHREAAGLPMAGQTAFHALHEVGDLDAGQRVLIHAAAGGVGHLAVQFAASAGAHVLGTASGYNEAYLHELGVDQFVNYREARFEDEIDDVDIVLDAVGGDVLKRSVEVVKPGGVVVTLPEPPAEEVVERYKHKHDIDVRFFDVILDSSPVTLRRVAAHADSEAVEPRVSNVYSLSEVPDALEESTNGHVRGKLVIDLTEDNDD